MNENLRFGTDRLGVMTPHAPQTASFEEDGGANAGAIVYGKSFYVEDATFDLGGISHG